MNNEIYLEHSKYIFPKLTYDEWLLEMDIDDKYILKMDIDKEQFYPEEFSEKDEFIFDFLFEQSKLLFPKLACNEWVLKVGIFNFMKKEEEKKLNNSIQKPINND